MLLALITVALAVGSGLSSPRPAAADDKQSAIDNYGGCLVAQHQGDLLLLIDESASMKQTDPHNARVSAAQYLINQLGRFSARDKVNLDVQVAGFSTGYHPTGGWSRMPGKSGSVGSAVSKINSTIDGYAHRTSGYQTDYWGALDGARSALATKARQSGSNGTRCQAVVWISDGDLDLSLRTVSNPTDEAEHKTYAPKADLTTDRGAEQAQQAATHDLCRTGGIADQLRRSDVALFAIGLESSKTDKKPNFSTMKAISTGSDDCGKITDPKPGLFTLASNIDDLLFAFDKIMDPGREPTEQETGICQGKLCTEYRHNFVLDDSISAVHILGSAPAGLDVYLVPPKGSPLRFRPTTVGKTTKIKGAASGSVQWLSDKSMSIDLSRSRSWAGQWAVVFVDPSSKTAKKKSRTSIHISGDLYPALAKRSKITFRSGNKIKGVRLGLVNGAGKKIDPAKLLGTVAMDAELSTGGKTVSLGDNLTAARLNKPFTVDLSKIDPGRATLKLRLDVTTASTHNASGKKIPGTALSPQRVNIPLTIVPPLGYPQLGGQADFGSIEGAADATATVPVTGPGCVWVASGTKPQVGAGPEGLGTVAITTDADKADNCVKIPGGTSGQLKLKLTTDEGGNGTLDGTIAVRIAPKDDPGKARTVQLPYTADLHKPLNTFNFIAALLVALILGVGIPPALLYLTKYLTAKIPPRALLGQRIDITVDGDRVLRDGQPLAFRPGDLTDMVRLPISGARQADAGGFGLSTRIGKSPFGPGFVLVDAPGMIGASSTDPEPYVVSGSDGRRAARLPLAVHNTWALLHDPTGPADRATLLILLGTDASEDRQRRQEYLDDINARVPELLLRLRGSTGGPSTASVDPFAGGPSGGVADPSDPFGLDLPATNTGGFDFGSPAGRSTPPQTAAEPASQPHQQSVQRPERQPPQHQGPEPVEAQDGGGPGSVGESDGPSTGPGPSDAGPEDLTFDFDFSSDPPADDPGGGGDRR
jgi:hypothetical protein